MGSLTDARVETVPGVHGAGVGVTLRPAVGDTDGLAEAELLCEGEAGVATTDGDRDGDTEVESVCDGDAVDEAVCVELMLADGEALALPREWEGDGDCDCDGVGDGDGEDDGNDDGVSVCDTEGEGESIVQALVAQLMRLRYICQSVVLSNST